MTIVDTITLFSFLKCSDETQGQGQLLIQTVKLAFSVTNNVIRLKPPSSVVSPLEQALTQHGMYFLVGMPWEAVGFVTCKESVSFSLQTEFVMVPKSAF